MKVLILFFFIFFYSCSSKTFCERLGNIYSVLNCYQVNIDNSIFVVGYVEERLTQENYINFYKNEKLLHSITIDIYEIKNFDLISIKSKNNNLIIDFSYGGGKSIYDTSVYFKIGKDKLILSKVIRSNYNYLNDNIVEEEILFNLEVSTNSFYKIFE